MEQNLKNYLYAIFSINILAHILLILNLAGELQLIETSLLVAIIASSAYMAFLFEAGPRKPYLATMILFTLIVINSIIVYFFSGMFNIAFIALLNVLGIYTTITLIPEKKTKKDLLNEVFEKPKPNYLQPLHPLKEDEILPIDKEVYADRTLKKFEEDFIDSDDKEDSEDNQIVVEEIKPAKETKVAKKHIPKKLQKTELKRPSFVQPLHELKEDEILPIDKVEMEQKKILRELDEIDKKLGETDEDKPARRFQNVNEIRMKAGMAPLHELKEDEILPIDKAEMEERKIEKKIIKELETIDKKVEKKLKKEKAENDFEEFIQEIKPIAPVKVKKAKKKKSKRK